MFFHYPCCSNGLRYNIDVALLALGAPHAIGGDHAAEVLRRLKEGIVDRPSPPLASPFTGVGSGNAWTKSAVVPPAAQGSTNASNSEVLGP
jgi:hypothetical protein